MPPVALTGALLEPLWPFGDSQMAGTLAMKGHAHGLLGFFGSKELSMKRALILSAGLFALGLSSASAADMAVKAPGYMPPPAPIFTWTGFYIGANAGLGGDKVDYPFQVFGTPGDINLTSFGGFG